MFALSVEVQNTSEKTVHKSIGSQEIIGIKNELILTSGEIIMAKKMEETISTDQGKTKDNPFIFQQFLLTIGQNLHQFK